MLKLFAKTAVGLSLMLSASLSTTDGSEETQRVVAAVLLSVTCQPPAQVVVAWQVVES